MEYVDKLNNIGLYFEAAIADQPATDQPVVTKKRVVECLQQIGQQELAEILITSQGKIFPKNKLSRQDVSFTILMPMKWSQFIKYSVYMKTLHDYGR